MLGFEKLNMKKDYSTFVFDLKVTMLTINLEYFLNCGGKHFFFSKNVVTYTV